jgi:hypothetical protein
LSKGTVSLQQIKDAHVFRWAALVNVYSHAAAVVASSRAAYQLIKGCASISAAYPYWFAVQRAQWLQDLLTKYLQVLHMFRRGHVSYSFALGRLRSSQLCQGEVLTYLHFSPLGSRGAISK